VEIVALAGALVVDRDVDARVAMREQKVKA
jgi:hypothetical protein